MRVLQSNNNNDNNKIWTRHCVAIQLFSLKSRRDHSFQKLEKLRHHAHGEITLTNEWLLSIQSY